MKMLGSQSKASEINLTNRIRDVEERVSGTENKVKELNASDKETVKLKKREKKN